MFVTIAVSPEKTQKQAAETSPLWARMSAVRNGTVFDAKDEIWISGIGVQAAHLVLDDLVRSFGVDARR